MEAFSAKRKVEEESTIVVPENTNSFKKLKNKEGGFIDELKSMDPVPTKATSWNRRPLPDINPAIDSIAFQWVDIGVYDGQPLKKNPKEGQVIPGSSEGIVPIIRVCGVNAGGNSIMAHIHGFVPYFYSSCPPGFKVSDCGAVKEALEKSMTSTRGNNGSQDTVLGVDMVHEKMSLYGYHFEKKSSFLIIYMAMPAMVSKARGILESSITIPGYGNNVLHTYESNVPFILRFMIDQEISGCNWLEFPASTYSIRESQKCVSLCQMEIDIVYLNILSHPAEGQWSKLAPIRILSFDIECMGRKGHFPEADKDPVIQIANVVKEQGSENPIIRNVFVLGTSKPIVGAHVMEFEKEEELLESWASFVRQCDPDLITGYNTENFDVPYIMDRGKTLNLQTYHHWGRLKNTANYAEKKSFSSAQYGKSEGVKTTVHGRCMFDLFPIMRRNYQLSSYSLNAVSAHFLGQQKEDVPHGIISDLQQGNDDDRHRLAVYCLKDALLPMRLMDKLSLLVNYVEMARVTGVPLDFLIDRGQQIKVYSMLLRKAQKAGLLVPHMKRNAEGDSTYEGATVIDPKRAYYTDPVATLDFASLYPSIMQAYNLCYSTLVSHSDIAKLDSTKYQKSPSGDYFVTSSTRKGILPIILDELLSARKRAKQDMKNATDPMEKAVQNGRQLALKISANSVYGFTGANVGQLPCIPIASSVTSYGRDLLFRTKTEVEKLFTIENGYPFNAEVVYGDTDSVMVKFGVKTVAEAMPLAIEAADKVSSIFPKPIKLEFEKVYYPYLLMNKKRYAGLLWTNPEKYDKLDSKGLETVRRDNCVLVRKVVDTCLRKILIEQDVDGAINYTKGLISDLLQNKMDISLLVITKGLSKLADSSDYKAKSAHGELALRMRKRDPGTAPGLGDRVAYVIVDKGNKAKLYEKAEDPVYVLENNIPIDCNYYLQQQLEKPLERIFEPIVGIGKVKSQIFSGEHTLKKSKPAPKQQVGGLLSFTIKKQKCLSCKRPMSGKDALCENCLPNKPEEYSSHLKELNGLSRLFSRLWTQCQNCQGSLHQDVLCTSRDCPIFYKRIKVQKDLEAAQKTLDRFEQVEW